MATTARRATSVRRKRAASTAARTHRSHAMKGQQAALPRIGVRAVPRPKRRALPWSSHDRAALWLGRALVELSRARRQGELTAGELDRYSKPVEELYRMLLRWSDPPAGEQERPREQARRA